MQTRPRDKVREFKKGFNEQERQERQKRSNSKIISLRKDAKARVLQRRRLSSKHGGSGGVAVGGSGSETKNVNDEAGVEGTKFDEEMLGRLRDCLAKMGAPDTPGDVRHKATLFVRRLSAREYDPPLVEIAKEGGIEAAALVLSRSQHLPTRVEACWILTNIASGDHELTDQIIAKPGVLDMILDAFDSEHFDLHEQAVWALANIAGDQPAYARLLMYKYELVTRVLQVALRTTYDKELVYCRNVAWLMGNLCRNHQGNGKIIPLLPALARYLEHPDLEVMDDTSNALRWFSEEMPDGNNTNEVNALINHPTVLPYILRLLNQQQPPQPQQQEPQIIEKPKVRKLPLDVLENLLKILANIALGDNYQTDKLIASGALNVMIAMLTHPQQDLVLEVCFALSNVASGTHSQIQQILQPQAMTGLAQVIRERSAKVQTEAYFVFVNATTYGSPEQVKWLIEEGKALPILCQALSFWQPKLIACALVAIQNVLDITDRKYIDTIEEIGGLEKIQGLTNNANLAISEKATELIDTYFDSDHEPESELEVEHEPGSTSTPPFAFSSPLSSTSPFSFGLPSVIPSLTAPQPPRPQPPTTTAASNSIDWNLTKFKSFNI